MPGRIPLIPTLVVLAAVAVMIRLGFWQLDRLHQKEALLAHYQAALGMTDSPAWPSSKEEAAQVLYRQARIDCLVTGADKPVSGRNAKGEGGWAHVLPCTLDGGKADVVIGWSRDPRPAAWDGGAVSGTIVEGIDAPARLVADPPLAGLEANARPDPRDIPNNHLSYAVQWFLFALTALVIYALALRKRLAAPGGEG